MGLRLAKSHDLKFVEASWRTSSEMPFLEGKRLLWPHLADSIAKCRKFNNMRMLKQIYNSEIMADIGKAIQLPVLVVYDLDNPTYIVAWGCASFTYVKQPYRKAGIGTFLRGCFAQPAQENPKIRGSEI